MDSRTSLNGFPKVAVQMGGGSDGQRTWISGFPKVAVQMGGGSDGKRSASARILASDLVLVHFEAKHKDFKAFWRFRAPSLPARRVCLVGHGLANLKKFRGGGFLFVHQQHGGPWPGRRQILKGSGGGGHLLLHPRLGPF